MQRIPNWLVVLLWCVTLASFIVAAFPALQGTVIETGAILVRFIAPGILLLLAVFVSAFDILLSTLTQADIQTWVFLGAVAVSGALFTAGFFVHEAASREVLQKAAFSVGAGRRSFGLTVSPMSL